METFTFKNWEHLNIFWFLFERFLMLPIRTFQIVFHCKSLVKKPCTYLLYYSFEDGGTIESEIEITIEA